jgi:hypothetical protein
MIRDPSDGSTREKPVVAQNAITAEPTPDPLFEEIRVALLAGKVKPERVSDKWEYQRAWNDGIEFALRQIQQIQKGPPGFGPSTAS